MEKELRIDWRYDFNKAYRGKLCFQTLQVINFIRIKTMEKVNFDMRLFQSNEKNINQLLALFAHTKTI